MIHKKKNCKLDFKIKRFSSEKEPVERIKRQITEWLAVFANHIFNKGQVLRIYF